MSTYVDGGRMWGGSGTVARRRHLSTVGMNGQVCITYLTYKIKHTFGK